MTTKRQLLRSLFVVFVVSLVAGRIAAEEAPPSVGDKAESFEAVTPEGEEVKFSAAGGKHPTVLVFLRGFPGYQCPICTRQVGELVRKADEIAATKAQVVLIYPGPGATLAQKAKQFDGSRGLPDGFQLVIDPDYEIVEAYHLRWDEPRETAYPSTLVVDREGTIRYIKVSKTHGGRPPVEEVLQSLQEIADGPTK